MAESVQRSNKDQTEQSFSQSEVDFVFRGLSRHRWEMGHGSGATVEDGASSSLAKLRAVVVICWRTVRCSKEKKI
jgi:hypothetical protein